MGDADKPIVSAPAPAASWLRAALLSPLLILSWAILACILLLTRPLILPLGPMYWDLAPYLDAANRIAGDRLPLIDFFTPVGPLGYWLFAWLGELFTQSQPLLLAQWSIFLVTAPRPPRDRAWAVLEGLCEGLVGRQASLPTA